MPFQRLRSAVSTQLVIMLLVVVAALLCKGSTGQETTDLGNTVATVDTTARPIVSENGTGTFELTDDTGDVWHLLEGSLAVENKHAETPAATHAAAAASEGPTQSGSSDRAKIGEVEAHGTSGHTSEASTASTGVETHHKTSVTGPVIVGAIGILCVGAAAGVAARKKAAAGGGHH